MSISTINSSDALESTSRTKINDNFTDLDTTKADLVSPSFTTPDIGAATGTSLALGGGTALTTTNQTGTGNLVLATSPTLTTPTLGVATASNIGIGAAANNGFALNIVTNAATMGRAMQVTGDNVANLAIDSLVSGNSELRWQVRLDGKMDWGDGTASPDTNLYRSAANVLKTDDTFNAAIAVITPFLADTNGNEQLILSTTASAVNEITLANAATGNNPSFTASGETNVGLVLSGKGTRGVIMNNAMTEKVVAISDGAGAVINASLGNVFTWTAAADRTAGTTTNPVAGQKIIIAFTASGGARTLTLPTATTGDFIYGSDITVLTQTASGKTDYIGCIYNGTRWAVVAYTKGF